MLTELQIKNFKSWSDTGVMRLGSLTGLFGTNSSGKTSILQFLLMLKQTVEFTDRQRVLFAGNNKSYVSLGTFTDYIHRHNTELPLHFSLSWQTGGIVNGDSQRAQISSGEGIRFEATIIGDRGGQVKQFTYSHAGSEFGMQRRQDNHGYDIFVNLSIDGFIESGKPSHKFNDPPIKHYGFPSGVISISSTREFLESYVVAYEQVWQQLYYLGPLRNNPQRSYVWGGEVPQSVGSRGEFTIAALLASRNQETNHKVEERVAYWLKQLGMIDNFEVRPVTPNAQDFEVWVRKSQGSAEVRITDVGFGVSQILPVLTLCFYVPEGSTVIFEQPEIHLHPKVQAGLADVFIDAIKLRKIQIIVESHSEHLLRRLQRRIAEEEINSADTALYFVDMEAGNSQLRPLEIDTYGNISNWPQHFFGDEMGDLVAMTQAAIKRQENTTGNE